MVPPGEVLQYLEQAEGVFPSIHQVTVRFDSMLRMAHGAAVYQPVGNGLATARTLRADNKVITATPRPCKIFFIMNTGVERGMKEGLSVAG